MTTEQFKFELRNLSLKVGDKIILNWMDAVIESSVHIVTDELLKWISLDEVRSNVGLLSNPLEDEDEVLELTSRTFEIGGKIYISYQGKMPIKTIPLIVKYPGEKGESYMQEMSLAHIIGITLIS
jgi:hypothetical protein